MLINRDHSRTALESGLDQATLVSEDTQIRSFAQAEGGLEAENLLE
jgi:hypothetical protein